MRNALHRQVAVNVGDVARAAGCSTATVSRALNRPEKVRPVVRERVLAAAERLGYVPNNAARALRQNRTGIMGTVIPTLNHAIYARLVEGLQKRIVGQGFALLHTTSEYDLAAELEQAKLLLERGVQGLMLVGDLHDPRLYELLARHGVPYVNTYVFTPHSPHPCVGFDNRRAMADVASFLLDLGHRRFAMIAGITAGNDRALQRVEGVVTTLEGRGLVLPAGAIEEAPYDIASGRAAMRRILSLPERPSAVVCGSDILAFGAMIECHDRAIEVPRAISIMGFDDLEFAAQLRPALSTVEVPAAEMGARAGDYLLARCSGARHHDHVELETRLIMRKTTAAPLSATADQPLTAPAVRPATM